MQPHTHAHMHVGGSAFCVNTFPPLKVSDVLFLSRPHTYVQASTSLKAWLLAFLYTLLMGGCREMKPVSAAVQTAL